MKNGKTEPERKLYLAYGSNLNLRGMASRCPDAKPVGARIIKNARLVFRGVADMIYEPGSECACGLWEVSARDEEGLDRYEGVPRLYGRYTIPVKFKGKRREALIYLMHDTGIYPPSAYYVSVLRQGFRDFKLDQSYLDEAIEHSFNDKNVTEQTKSRRERQRQSTHQYKLVTMPESVALARVDAERAAAIAVATISEPTGEKQ